MDAVLGVAKRLDKKNQAHLAKPRHSPRNVYFHEKEDEEIEFYGIPNGTMDDVDSTTFDINTTIHEVNAASHRPGSRFSGVAWHGMSFSGQKTWDTLSEDDNSTIIRHLSSTQGGFRGRKSGWAPSPRNFLHGKPHTPTKKGPQFQGSKGSVMSNL